MPAKPKVKGTPDPRNKDVVALTPTPLPAGVSVTQIVQIPVDTVASAPAPMPRAGGGDPLGNRSARSGDGL